MIYTGLSAINFLAEQVKKDDLAASSHWRKYHTGFQFTGDNFVGLQGFGNLEKPYRKFHLLAHFLLQMKFRRMGSLFTQFTQLDPVAKKIAKRQDRSYNLDFLRQTLTLSFLKKHIPQKLAENNIVWVIGDGFGSMTSLLLESKSASCVVLINLTKTLLVDLWYLKLSMGEEAFEKSVDLVTEENDIKSILAQTKGGDKTPRVIAIQALDHNLLDHVPASLVINIASMQEMDPSVIASYFTHIYNAAQYSDVAFYCCNREEKVLPDGVITRFSEYPWKFGDNVLVDELCPWHQQYYLLKRPYYRSYDGSVRHQLRIIKK